MIAVFLKDLRETWAAPITLAALVLVSCLVLALAAALPLPEPQLRIGVAPTVGNCLSMSAAVNPEPAGAAAAAASPSTDDAVPEFDEEEQTLPSCPFPDRSILIHSIQDLTGANYRAIEPGSAETPWAHAPADRWVESEAWDMMDRERLDVLFVWYPTAWSQDGIASSGSALDWMRTYGAEPGGVWMAYTQSRSTAHAGQIRFSVRQAQASATHIANARRNTDRYAAPSAGFADAFTEFAPLLVGRAHRDRQEHAWVARRPAVEAALEQAIEEYSQSYGQALSETAARHLREALASAYSGLPADSPGELFERFASALEPHVDAEPELAPAPEPQPLSATPAPPQQPGRVDPAAGPVPAPPSDAIFRSDIRFFTDRIRPGFYEALTPAPGEAPLPVLTPFLLSERDGPPRSTSAWLIPGLILIIGSAIAFMLAAGSTVREREHGTEHLLKAGREWWRAAVGKALAPAVAAFAIVLMLIMTAQVFFGFQIKPGWPLAIFCAALALLAASFQGVAVGSLLRNQSAALAISGAYLICLILFGDILIPMDAAAWPTAWLSQALPTRQLSQDWTDWMTWGVALRGDIFVGLALLVVASLASLLLASFVRHRSV